jgi:hypothetical protein
MVEVTDRRDVWVGLKPTVRLQTSRGRRCREKKKTKENERKRKRKTLLGEKKEVSLKEFDRADIVRDVRLRRLPGLS